MGNASNKTVCVLIPTFCGSGTLSKTLESLREQSNCDFRIYIRDDTPRSNHAEIERLNRIIRNFEHTLEITVRSNNENLGYPKNLALMVEETTEEFIFLAAQDDIISPFAIEYGLHALTKFPVAGAVSRSYYWFDRDWDTAVRAVMPLTDGEMVLVTKDSPWIQIERVLFASGQLSGLMYRRSCIHEPFVESIFPAHVYPIAGILRDYGVVYISHFTVAVSILDSQTRALSDIYKESPTRAWLALYQKVFGEFKSSKISKRGRNVHMGKNFVGLIQVRTYGRFRWFLRECILLVLCRPLNLIDPRFWISALSLTILPPRTSRFLADSFKSVVVARRLRGVQLLRNRPESW